MAHESMTRLDDAKSHIRAPFPEQRKDLMSDYRKTNPRLLISIVGDDPESGP